MSRFDFCFNDGPTAVTLLKDKEPGAFVIRDSHSYRGAYGLAVKVSEPPLGLEQPRKGTFHSTLYTLLSGEGMCCGYRLGRAFNKEGPATLHHLYGQHDV